MKTRICLNFGNNTPRVSIASQKRAPGPATYNAVPNSFGRQFRVGKGLSSPQISFSTAARFQSNDANTNAYAVTARPRSAFIRKKSRIVAKAGRKDTKTRGLHRPKTAPVRRHAKTTPARAKNRSKTSNRLVEPQGLSAMYIETKASVSSAFLSARHPLPLALEKPSGIST